MTRIGELLGREKSQVSRALKALSEYGLVERNEDSSYRLGWRFYVLAELSGDRRLLKAATPVMRRAAVALGERMHLSVLQGTEALTIHSESAGRSVEAVGWTGRVTPVYATSAGRALIVDWDDAEIEELFAGTSFESLGPRTVGTPRELVEKIKEGRERGYMVVDEEFEPGLISVAVSIRDGGGAVVAALNVSAPRYRFTERIEEAAAQLRGAGAEITARISPPALTPSSPA